MRRRRASIAAVAAVGVGADAFGGFVRNGMDAVPAAAADDAPVADVTAVAEAVVVALQRAADRTAAVVAFQWSAVRAAEAAAGAAEYDGAVVAAAAVGARSTMMKRRTAVGIGGDDVGQSVDGKE